MSKEQLYTPEGYQKLVDELNYLSTTRRDEIKKDIAGILEKYLGSIKMSEDEVKAAVAEMDLDTQEEAFFEIDDLLISIDNTPSKKIPVYRNHI